MAKSAKLTNIGTHTGAILKVKVVQQGRAKYAPKGVARAEDVYRQMTPYFGSLAQEEFWVLCCNNKNIITGSACISRGTVDMSLVHPREVFKVGICGNAASIILVHNHPSGNTEPSEEDLAVTRRIAEAGRLLDVPVLDHVIMGADDYVSLAERGEV